MASNIFHLTYNSYPEAARGWVDGVYYPRVEKVQSLVDADLKAGNSYYTIKSRVWKETEETGFGIFQYEETTAINYELENGNYQLTIKFTNPTDKPYKAGIKVNNIMKISDIEIGAEEQEETLTVCIVNGLLSLKIIPECISETYEDASYANVYVKDINIMKLPLMKPGDKPVIYLVSDSTVQSYDKNFYPQTGWGEVLIQYFQKDKSKEFISPRPKVYETEDIIIDNRAIGGRSSKSFLEEGRLDSILKNIRENDYVFIQFGHNDAYKARPNRYVSDEDFSKYLQYYIDGILQRKAICVLVTPVARRDFDEKGKFKISFNQYREVMLKLSKEQNIPLLDLGKATTEYLDTVGPEESKKLFLWASPGEYPEGKFAEGVEDDTHLHRRGAIAFAGILAKLIKEYDKDNRLDYLKNAISII
ncbi:MAG: rhamnogalacturonan acetylesterase [Clostridiales bacterium]|nr:rhamnogalacturonan acetylesterase [Clostridiales bacterium]